MIKRYELFAVMLEDNCNDWCKYSGVEQLEQELTHWKTMCSINEPGQKQVHENLVDGFKELQRERDQLAARVEHYLEWLEDWLPNEAFESLVGSTENYLQAQNKALLLRLADEYKAEHVTDLINRNYVAVWLRAKANEL